MSGEQTSERVDGATPNGGVYAVANFLDGDRSPTSKAGAVFVEILEFDEDDENVGRTWLTVGEVGKPEGAKALAVADETEVSVPTAEVILNRALLATGHTDAWQAGTLSDRQQLDVLHAVRLEARATFRAMAEATLESLDDHESKALFGATKAAIDRFFGKAGKFVREAIVAGVLAISGPDSAAMDHPVVQEAIEAQVAEQLDYLDAFHAEILEESKPLDGTFVSRAELYGGAAWAASQQIQRGVAKKTGIFNFESREHFGVDDNDLCGDCTREIKKGIVPIGTLRVIGDSTCKGMCHCAFNFYETKDGPQYTTIFAGRGPMSFSVFGRTG